MPWGWGHFFLNYNWVNYSFQPLALVLNLSVCAILPRLCSNRGVNVFSLWCWAEISLLWRVKPGGDRPLVIFKEVSASQGICSESLLISGLITFSSLRRLWELISKTTRQQHEGVWESSWLSACVLLTSRGRFQPQHSGKKTARWIPSVLEESCWEVCFIWLQALLV